jgi:hypothetical protein
MAGKETGYTATYLFEKQDLIAAMERALRALVNALPLLDFTPQSDAQREELREAIHAISPLLLALKGGF